MATVTPVSPASLARPGWHRAIPVLLALIAGGARWLTRTQLVYGWDSVHYMLAQDRYDIRAHQPHPPGSYYYVLLARAVRELAGCDAYTALLATSAVFGGILVLALYRMARDLAGEEAGWLAAVFGGMAPLFWFYGSVGLNYGPGGTVSALAALGCVWLALPGFRLRGGILAGCALGILGGFRPTDVIFLAPAYGWSLLAGAGPRETTSGTDPAPARVAAISLAFFGVLTLGWLVPNVRNCGGLTGYLDAMRAQEHLLKSSSALLAGWPALREASITHLRCLEGTLGLGWLLLVGAAVLGRAGKIENGLRRAVEHRCVGAPPDTIQPSLGRRAEPAASAGAAPGPSLLPLSLLITAPAFGFYLLGHFNSPGYALTYSGYLAALAAVGCVRGMGAGLRRFVPALALAVLAGNAVLFSFGCPGVGNAGQRSLSYRELADHDRYYRDVATYLAARHAPGTVRLLSSWNSTDGLRVVETLLPPYSRDVAQAVGEIPQLPSLFHSLSWLRLMTPAQIRAERRPVYAIYRTREDPGYHRILFGDEWDLVPIGAAHFLFHLRGTPL